MPAALIDVLLPTYNNARTIKSAVESMQRQTLADLRIIVVDDGSTDGTGAILSELAAEDARVHIITTANGGIVDALNIGLAQCTAPFVARHDGDDLAAPHRLATQLAYLEANPDCIAVSCNARHIDENGRPTGSVTDMAQPSGADAARIPAREPYLLHPFLTARRACLESAGGYRYVFHAEDVDLYWRLLGAGRLHNQDLVLGDYRMHGNSLTGSSILNGRIAAMYAQLAAISATRRREGQPDLDFPKAALAECAAARDLSRILEIGARGLTDDEARRLRSATAGQLLMVAGYRPYEFELDDCRVIRRTLENDLPEISPENRNELDRIVSGTAARLASQNKIREALAICPPRLRHLAVARTALRLAMPDSLRHFLRRALGRSSYAR